MEYPQFLTEMADILDMPHASLTGTAVLNECESWDSLAMLSFTVMCNEKANREIPGRLIRSARTIDDLYALTAADVALSKAR
jgi:hypothetical protein